METSEFIDRCVAAVPKALTDGRYFAGKDVCYGEFGGDAQVVEAGIARVRETLVKAGCTCGPIRMEHTPADGQGPSLTKGKFVLTAMPDAKANQIGVASLDGRVSTSLDAARDERRLV